MVTLEDLHDVGEAIEVHTRGVIGASSQIAVDTACIILARRTPGKSLFMGLDSCADELRPWKSGIVSRPLNQTIEGNSTFRALYHSGIVPPGLITDTHSLPSSQLQIFLVELSSILDACCQIEKADTDRLGTILRQDLWERMRSHGKAHPLFDRANDPK